MFSSNSEGNLIINSTDACLKLSFSIHILFQTEHVANHPDKQLPLPPPSLISGTAKNSGPIVAGSGVIRKKVDRQTLERGAEVIRCLCGFRVEGGHVMIQCSACCTRQHLPCVWWALALALNPRLSAPATPQGAFWPSSNLLKVPISSDYASRCRAAMAAALSAGGRTISTWNSVYFCPNCLELDGLTKDYPRTLAASLEVDNVTAVFSKASQHEKFEYWSLGTPDGEQYLTDEFAVIHRHDYEAATATGLEESDSTLEITNAVDAVVVRIYQLWKDTK